MVQSELLWAICNLLYGFDKFNDKIKNTPTKTRNNYYYYYYYNYDNYYYYYLIIIIFYYYLYNFIQKHLDFTWC